MRRAAFTCAAALALASSCVPSNLAPVRRERCEGVAQPEPGQLSRGDACAAAGLEAGDPAEAARLFALGCEQGSALACHHALASAPEARNVFLEGPGGADAPAAEASLPPDALRALRESAARLCLASTTPLRLCVGAALLFSRVEPRDPVRARDLLAHGCRTAGDCAHYRLAFEDRDGDALVDRADACPDAAEDLDGRSDEDGCPDLDEDGDGRRDDEELCPGAAEDLDGFEDADGCPDPDDDADGVLDAADACPREAETRNEHRDEDGCPDVAPRCACRFELAAAPSPRACASGPGEECAFATLRSEAEALICVERTRGCPEVTLPTNPEVAIRELSHRLQVAQLAASERLRARPRNARTLRAYADALSREAEAIALASLRLGRVGTAAFSGDEARDALARLDAAHEASLRALARLAPEDREAVAPSAGTRGAPPATGAP